MSNKVPRIGITLGGRGVPMNTLLSLAQEAEEAGIYAIGVGEAALDSFSLLSAIAAVTSRIRLVSSTATWTRTPVTTARAVRTLDGISNGRYSLGLGSMPPQFNEDLHGIPYKAPLKRMQEYIEAIRLLVEAEPGNPIDYYGSFYKVVGYRATDPPPSKRIPILIGATRTMMTKLTGRIADGVIFNFINSVGWLTETALPSLAEGAKTSGRSLDNLDKSTLLYTLVTNNSEQYQTSIRRTIGGSMYAPYNIEWLKANDFRDEERAITTALAAGNRKGVYEAITDRLINTVSAVGSPEKCRERVSEYGSILDWVLLGTPGGLSPEEYVNAIRQIINTFRA
jgi:5,10-methylenetetrahydromethanopterin reductase